ncbi:MAG: type II toxin-antitoxin system HicB family antitoxin [Flavobacteriaceae bacterium]|jgi:predicted RNase H-like HicB family nuclease|nr:type II toxin-antitoxin system HicB family antitoxin [Flavobacteriaceae bacterium]
MQKNKVFVKIGYTGNNFGAYVPLLDGCVATGATPKEVIENIKEAIAFHIQSSLEDNEPIPEVFKSDYILGYKFNAESLLNYYKGIFTNAALERMTGINQKQVQHYASGLRKPSPETKKKIETALHRLGEELIAVEL